jgi:hypothetical protein
MRLSEAILGSIPRATSSRTKTTRVAAKRPSRMAVATRQTPKRPHAPGTMKLAAGPTAFCRMATRKSLEVAPALAYELSDGELALHSESEGQRGSFWTESQASATQKALLTPEAYRVAMVDTLRRGFNCRNEAHQRLPLGASSLAAAGQAESRSRLLLAYPNGSLTDFRPAQCTILVENHGRTHGGRGGTGQTGCSRRHGCL